MTTRSNPTRITRRLTRRMLLSLAATSAFPMTRLLGQGPIHPLAPTPPKPRPSTDSDPVFTANSNLVPLDVQVLDTATRHPIPDLRNEDFLVYDDGNPVPVALFDDSPAPLNLLLLIDVSGANPNEGAELYDARPAGTAANRRTGSR